MLSGGIPSSTQRLAGHRLRVVSEEIGHGPWITRHDIVVFLKYHDVARERREICGLRLGGIFDRLPQDPAGAVIEENYAVVDRLRKPSLYGHLPLLHESGHGRL